MILTMDIGNSNIVSVTYTMDGKRIKGDRRITIREASYERYTEIMKDLSLKLEMKNLNALIISCVVPYITDCVRDVAGELFPHLKIIVLDVKIVPELKIKLDHPKELGADMIASSFGAINNYKDNCIIADLGSATKISVVTKDATFLGGVIIPGIQFQAKSLHMMIPHLPEIEIEKPKSIIGNSTTHSIQSGIINGTLASVIELAAEIEEELGYKCKKIITGGLSKLFSKEDLEDYVYDEFLISDGLYYIAKKELEKANGLD